jgi:hypothetical protein
MAGEKKTNFKHPKTVVQCAKRLVDLEEQLDKNAILMKPINDEYGSLRDHMLETFKKDEINGLTTQGKRFSVVVSTVPTMKDWATFFEFARKKGNEDLLQRSVNSPAWRERNDAGKVVPGVEAFGRVSLRISTVKE